MPFTGAQRAEIRAYMGWPARFYQTQPELELALNAVEMDIDEFNRVTALLTSLEDIDAKLLDAQTRLKAQAVGSIKLPLEVEIAVLRSEGRRHVGRLAALLGVVPRADAFAGGATGRSNFIATGC